MENYRQVLQQYWGYDGFRGIQEDIIRSIGSGKDTLGLMPTGGGKSITFQVPALAKEGLCLVVTPLIALMKDQVRQLRSRGIKATAVYSGMTREEIVVALENCIFGNYKFLYISPERLATDIFRTKMRHMQVNLIAIDEAHCISQWGYDFRPSYLQIAEVRQLLPGVPVLALTATATPEVVEDIQQRLAFPQRNVFRMSFERKNLAYIVRYTENKPSELLHILNSLPGSAIAYTRNRKRTREVAEFLESNGISATYYHAGLANDIKDQRQKSWLDGQHRVMVATNAFGMGIDKPDVRLVVHIDCPDSPEAYFQEAGRAGRDGQKAYAVLLFAPRDKGLLQRRVEDTFPEKDYVRKVYEDLQYYYQMAMGDGRGCTFAFNIEEFCLNFKHFPVRVDSALKLLTRAGYLEYTDEQDNASRLMFTLRRDELYRIHENSEATEQLIRCLLRSYTGLFSDYAFIDEGFLSRQSGLSRQEVYESLVLLSHRRILHYIPGKKTPYIIYTRERQETERVVLTREVYEERKESYIRRIQAMTDYAGSQTHCRSQFLLRYFGEKDSRPCCQCDVCLQQHASGVRNSEFTGIADTLLQLLEEAPLTPAELGERMTLPLSVYEPVLRYLMNEEQIRLQEGKLAKASND
ncbi:MAG: RecQ family ATP-dependent DNA helicase [Phocaeicola plebeius]|nr:RecQ family ATP-dependent DNA helicase [Phocaeicola plebeius]